MKKKFFLLQLVLMLAATIATAQSSFMAQYSINFPMGSTSDFVGETSFRGATIDYRHSVTSNISVGGSLGWYNFYEAKAYDSYTTSDDAMTVSGKQYRYINSVPILVVADYQLNSEQKFSPFVGLGIGTTYNRLDTEMGLYTIREDNWQFTVAPEVGLRSGLSEGISGYLSARYNHSFEAGDIDEQSYVTLNIGISFDF